MISISKTTTKNGAYLSVMLPLILPNLLIFVYDDILKGFLRHRMVNCTGRLRFSEIFFKNIHDHCTHFC